MNTMGGQIRQGVADVGRAVGPDVAKGLIGIPEGIAKGMVGEAAPQQQENSEDLELMRLKQDSKKAAEERLAVVRQELEGVYKRRAMEVTQRKEAAEAQEQQKQQAQQEKKRGPSLAERLIAEAKRRGGGTGEVMRKKS